MRISPRLWLVLIVSGLVSSLVACGAEGDRPGVIVLPGMVESVPIDAYSQNARTGKGPAILQPPPGTVPMGSERFPFGLGDAEALRAGLEWKRPSDPTPEDLLRGQEVFTIYCQVCHGPTGDGDGPIIGKFPNPPSYHAARLKKIPDGSLYHTITRGKGIMASYAVQVPPADRWRVIAHIRTLQAASPTVADAALPAPGAGPATGAAASSALPQVPPAVAVPPAVDDAKDVQP